LTLLLFRTPKTAESVSSKTEAPINILDMITERKEPGYSVVFRDCSRSWQSGIHAQRLFALHPLFFSFIGSASWVSNIESEPNENVVLPIWNGRKLRPGRLVERRPRPR
jgi:hypothetical protein